MTVEDARMPEVFLRLLAGEPVLEPDPDLGALQTKGAKKANDFNAASTEDAEAWQNAAQALFGKIGPFSMIKSPISVDYGFNIEIGRETFINMNCTFLDGNKITIGDRVAIGPGTKLLTAGHPIKHDERVMDWPEDQNLPFRAVNITQPITIEDYCWLGAGVTVLPGVTIGKGSVIGASSVVTKDVPPGVVAVGNPCRVVRQI